MSFFFSKPKAPAPLNVEAVTEQANKQNTANAFQQAAFNRPNQTNQYGSTLSYKQTGTDAQGNPIFSQQQKLGAEGQKFAGGFSELGQQYIDAAGEFQGNRPDMSSSAAFDKADQFWQQTEEPRLAAQREAERTRLVNMGHDPRNEAFKGGMDEVARQQGDQRARFLNTAQNQFFGQGLADRNQQMSELGVLQPGVQYGGQSITGGFANVPNVNVANVDVAGLSQQNQNDQWKKYQSDMQGYNGMLGGLASIGGTILGGPIGSSIGSYLFGGGGNRDPMTGR